jgi:hypothetical protein
MRADGWTREDTWSCGLLVSRDSKVGILNLSTGVGLSHASVKAKGFTEHGAPGLNLAFEDFRRRDSEAYLSETLSLEAWHIGSARLIPSLDIETSHQFGDRNTTVRAQLLDNTAQATEGSATNGGRWRLGGGPALALVFRNGMKLEVRGQLESDFEGRIDRGVSMKLNYRY